MIYLADEKNVRPITIPEIRRTLNMRKDIIAFWKLLGLMRKERPDIIHTHTAKAGALGRLAGLLCRLSYQPKLIHTFHGHVLHNYFGRIKSALFIWIERLLAKFTDKIVAVSESVRRELIDLRIASPEKIITIPLGLELEKYLPIEKNDPKKRNYLSVGIVGRLVPVKNHRMFLDAAKRLRDNLSFEQRIKFFIVGDGPLRQGLESYAERLGLKQDVTFTGWIRDLEKIYTEMDIIVLTSLNEGTPVALIEAMAAGKPVISTEVGGVKDLFSNQLEIERNEDQSMIRYYDQGILVDSGDVVSMAAAIKKLLENDELRKKMGKRGRETVYPKYDASRLIDDMKIFYTNLAGERK